MDKGFIKFLRLPNMDLFTIIKYNFFLKKYLNDLKGYKSNDNKRF